MGDVFTMELSDRQMRAIERAELSDRPMSELKEALILTRESLEATIEANAALKANNEMWAAAQRNREWCEASAVLWGATGDDVDVENELRCELEMVREKLRHANETIEALRTENEAVVCGNCLPKRRSSMSIRKQAKPVHRSFRPPRPLKKTNSTFKTGSTPTIKTKTPNTNPKSSILTSVSLSSGPCVHRH